jgi:hypothetical protein
VDRLVANRTQDGQIDATAHGHGGDGGEPGIHGGVAGAHGGGGGAVRVGKAVKSARRRMREIGDWMYGDDPIRCGLDFRHHRTAKTFDFTLI